MASPVITLTTDFGTDSPYIAEMKGVILSINADVRLIDITHAIRPQEVAQAARVLANVVHRFPADTIHVAVVDPGVGTDRTILYSRFADQQVICPDNGLLTGLAARQRPSTMFALTREEYWLTPVSRTFHGRDIMAPVAARLSLGLAPERVGPRRNDWVQLHWPEAILLDGRIEGEVVAVDSFGNLITNITSEMLAGVPSGDQVLVSCDEHETIGIFSTYHDQPTLTLVAVVGSSGQLELAVVDENAHMMLGVKEGSRVTVQWRDPS